MKDREKSAKGKYKYYRDNDSNDMGEYIVEAEKEWDRVKSNLGSSEKSRGKKEDSKRKEDGNKKKSHEGKSERYGKPENRNSYGKGVETGKDENRNGYSKGVKTGKDENREGYRKGVKTGKYENRDGYGKDMKTGKNENRNGYSKDIRTGKYENRDGYSKDIRTGKYENRDGSGKYIKPGRHESRDRYGKDDKNGKYEKQDRYGEDRRSGKFEKQDRYGRDEKYGKHEKKSFYGDGKTNVDKDKKADRDSTGKEKVRSKDFNSNKKNREEHGRRNSDYLSGVKPITNEKGIAMYNYPIDYVEKNSFVEKEYQKELKRKQDKVEELLKKFGKVENIIGMKEPYFYRNKVNVSFDHDRKGNPISGVYEEGTHRVIPMDRCLIHNQKADEIIVSIRGLLKSFKIKTYDEDTGYGLLRHVLIRSGFRTGEIMVVLVLGSPIMPSKNNFVKALRKLHPEVTTVVVNVNDKSTSMVLGEKEQVIYGKGYIEDILCEKVFRISPKSFYQVNPVQTEIIYNKAVQLAGLTGEETVIDAYCGIGTISLIASDHAKNVIGVELNKDAIQDARINAKRNNIKNVDFICEDAGEFMERVADSTGSTQVVFMDPPRAGSDEKFLGSLCHMKPDRIVYISCNPVTLERDLQFVTKKGYRMKKAIPIDAFPWTEHSEVIVLLQRKG